MRTRALGLFLLAVSPALPACSALGLADLPQADCLRGSGGVTGDPFCASLATTQPPPDDCHTWQCNEQSHHCEILPKDDDGDGAPSMMCTPAGTTPDCDDMDMSDHPGGTETCDGLDQNCDGVPDDGAIEDSEQTASLTTLTGSPSQLALTYQPDADEAYLLTRSMSSFRGITVTGTAMPTDLTIMQSGSGAITAQMTDGAVAALGSQRYALAVRTFDSAAGGCQQWAVVPVRSSGGAVTLRSGTTTDAFQLPACPGGTQQVTAPALAGHATMGTSMSDTVLVAWLDGADDARACGSAPARSVRVSAAVLNDRTSAASRVSSDVVTLGDSVGDGSPAVISLGDAFLVAYPRADRTIAVHLVSVSVDASAVHVTAATSPEYVEPAGAMVPQSVSLARGATASGSTSIALSYTDGCAGSNDISVRLLTRNAAAVTGSSTAATGLGQGLARSRLQVAWQSRASEWVLGWRSASGVFVQRLFEDGAAEGGPFSVVSSSTVSAFAIEPMASGPLYRALVVDGTGLDGITFGCAVATP